MGKILTEFVKVFTDIDIGNIGRDIKKINKFYNLKRWQEMSILAYVKMMEIMFATHKDDLVALNEHMSKLDSINDDQPAYKGGMFG